MYLYSIDHLFIINIVNIISTIIYKAYELLYLYVNIISTIIYKAYELLYLYVNIISTIIYKAYELLYLYATYRSLHIIYLKHA